MIDDIKKIEQQIARKKEELKKKRAEQKDMRVRIAGKILIKNVNLLSNLNIPEDLSKKELEFLKQEMPDIFLKISSESLVEKSTVNQTD